MPPNYQDYNMKLIQNIFDQFNREGDTPTNGRRVSDTDYQLAVCIRDLLANQSALYARIARMEEQLNNTGTPEPSALNLGPAASNAREILRLSNTMIEIPIIHNRPDDEE